jgi:probable HAF family extracellular repeat protein
MRSRPYVLVLAMLIVMLMPFGLLAQQAKHQQYKVVILPPDGGPDSFFAGYLIYDALTDHGTAGVAADMSTGTGYNSYTWNNGKQTDLQTLPALGGSTSTSTFINWINEWAVAAGYDTRTNSLTEISSDSAVVWAPGGQVFQLSTPEGDQSHAVWINDFGQVSGWIENQTPDPCFSESTVGTQNQSQAVTWQFGYMRLLGTLGGTNSYGEFINNLGQVSGHSETSTVPTPPPPIATGCPPFDPFIWENGKLIDINPGNFGGAEGGTNFLSNGGYAVGFGTVMGEGASYPFVWHNGKLTNLFEVGNLGGSLNSALNSNDEGDVVGVSSVPDDSSFRSVMWRDGKFTDLGAVKGDACSEPYRINSHDQIVGFSGACDFSVQHAFLWENNDMVDLDTLIPGNLGIQLLYAAWINEEGVIAAQAIQTADGTYRAVLLIPNGESAFDPAASAAAIGGAATTQQSTTNGARLKDENGRLKPMFFRPFLPNLRH